VLVAWALACANIDIYCAEFSSKFLLIVENIFALQLSRLVTLLHL